MASSVTEDAWLDEVPADRPVVAVFEGLSMYLTQAEGHALIRRITSRFAGGELLFDVYGSWGIKLQKLVPAMRNAGATLHWGVDDPREIEALHPGLDHSGRLAQRGPAAPGRVAQVRQDPDEGRQRDPEAA